MGSTVPAGSGLLSGALQRLYEKKEDRYMQMLWNSNKVSLIHDVDNKGRNHYGTYYTKRKPLTAEEIKKRQV